MTALHEELKRLVNVVVDEADCDNQTALTNIVRELRQVADEERLSFDCAVGQTAEASLM
jgi:hypothetical protein